MSITVEKIALCIANTRRERHGLKLLVPGDLSADDGAWRDCLQEARAILALLQQGEPEGWHAKSGHDKFSFRNGIRFAVTWLHKRARSMNDPKAQTILNTAAFHLGIEISAAAGKAMLSASPLPAPGSETK